MENKVETRGNKRGRPKLPDELRKTPKYENTGMINYEAKKGDEIPKSFLNIPLESTNILDNLRINKVKNKNKKLVIDKFYKEVALKNNIDESIIHKIVEFRTKMIIRLINNAFEGKIIFKEFFTFEPSYKKLRYIVKSGLIFDAKYDGIREKILNKSFLEGIDLTEQDISKFLNQTANVVDKDKEQEIDKDDDDDIFYEEL